MQVLKADPPNSSSDPLLTSYLTLNKILNFSGFPVLIL